MGRKVELPVTGAPNARPKGAKKAKGKGKGRAAKMPTIGDDGGSPMFRLFLWVAMLAGLSYAATRVEWQGKTIAGHAGELVHWADVQAKGVAWVNDARDAVERWTRTEPRKDQVAETKAVEPKPAPKKVAATKPAVEAKPVSRVEKPAPTGEKPGPSAAEVRPTADKKTVANNTPHEEIGADDRAALERLMGR